MLYLCTRKSQNDELNMNTPSHTCTCKHSRKQVVIHFTNCIGQKQRKIALLLLMLAVSSVCIVASPPKTISVSHPTCQYDIHIPTGWDTIPQAVLRERIEVFDVDLGIYPIAQDDYFSGNYALYVFMPTLVSLNTLRFDQIVTEITAQNKQGEILHDTLQVSFLKTYPIKNENTYSIYSYFNVQTQSNSFDNCQMLRLTNFGYIMVLLYAKGKEALPIEEVATLLSNSVSVNPFFAYTEPEKKGLHWKHILISLAIGALVYILIAGIPKLKKKE